MWRAGTIGSMEMQQAARTPFEWIGGEDRVKALVERFYDLMELEPAYAAVRATHGSDLGGARTKTFFVFCCWVGGLQHYVERFGHPRLRMRHMGFSIGVRERDEWLACMDQAMNDCAVEQDLRRRLSASFFQTADWMRNKAA
jgi:hemoglobin